MGSTWMGDHSSIEVDAEVKQFCTFPVAEKHAIHTLGAKKT